LFESARIERQRSTSGGAGGAPLGTLAGVRFTAKESFGVAGTPTTVGLTDRASHHACVDADVVARLRAAGAILLGKTNVSQLLMFNETDNPPYGRTNNPCRHVHL
jgi:fatty acid amide hydrolase